ncbi:MAG: MFS transporter, partial [Geodermatophilaceae bacterium]|nr:MFS transporter [Geodermatophilaceae bacterium]
MSQPAATAGLAPDPEPAAAAGAFRSLRIRNFRLYAGANLVNNTGTWMQRIAQDWLVLQLSGSGLALGVVTALQFAPILVLSLYGGMLADRYDKRRLMMLTQATMGLAALVLGLLVLTDSVALWHVFVIAGSLGVAAAMDMPIRQSFASEIVGTDNLSNAVSLNSAIFNAARLVGPAIAGLMIAAAGDDTGPVFLLNAGSYVVTILALRFMRTAELQPSPEVPRGRGQLRAAVSYVNSHPDIKAALLLVFVVGTFGLNFQITMALMVTDVYGKGAEAFGLLSTAFAAGSLSGALLSTRRAGRPRQRTLYIAALLFGLLEVAAGLMPVYLSFAILLIPTGAAALTFMVAANSFVQLGIDPTMRGRVMALYFMAFMGGTPVGAPVVGWIGETLGAPVGLIAGGGIVAVAALALALIGIRQRGLRVQARVFPRPQ